ncbi:MAG: SDR family oxidoreductase [Magnetococcales bacterium]|nr:SDR family oxidoreductase [Magnetococcales bacterium]
MNDTPKGPDRRVFLTGGTGYIGRHLLVRLLTSGFRVLALVRPHDCAPEERILRALEPLGALSTEAISRLEWVAGDVTHPNCGLSASALERLRHLRPDTFIHCAGLTRFEERQADALQRINHLGTRHAFELCCSSNIPVFIHTSTAFVAGDTPVPFYSTDLEVGQGFHNPYERSKFDAERDLVQAVQKTSISLRIHRPSIVVGGIPIGEHSDVGTVYAFLKALHFIRTCCRLDHEQASGRLSALGVRNKGDTLFIPMRVVASEAVHINLVAIDHVVDTLMRDVDDPGKHPIRVRHVVAREGCSLATLRDIFCRVMRMEGVTFCTTADFENTPKNALEGRFHRATRVYDPYLQHTVLFQPDSDDPDGSSAVPVDPERVARQFFSLWLAGEERTPHLGRLTLDALGIDDPQRYFEGLVRGDFGADFLEKNNFITASIRFHVSGTSPFDQILHFSHGKARFLSAQATGTPDCSFDLDAATFRAIVRCHLDPKQAFFRGLIRIGGNRETGLKFAHLLSQYYRNINDHVLDEVARFS